MKIASSQTGKNRFEPIGCPTAVQKVDNPQPLNDIYIVFCGFYMVVGIQPMHNLILHPLKISSSSLNPGCSTALLLKCNNNRTLSLTYFRHLNRTCSTVSISSWQWSHLPVRCFPTNVNALLEWKGGYLVSCTTEWTQMKHVFRI